MIAMRVKPLMPFLLLAASLISLSFLPSMYTVSDHVEGGPNTRATIDVGVTDITMEPGPYYPELYPLVPILFKSKVVNFADNLIGNLTVLFTVGDNPFQANQTISNFQAQEEINLQWNFTPEQVGDYLFVITALIQNDENASNNQKTLPINVVDSGYLPQLFTTENETAASPGKSCVFHLQLKNGGTKSDTFDISIDSIPPDWNASLSDDDIPLGPNEVVDVSLTVNLSHDHSLSLEGEEYFASIFAFSMSYPYVVATKTFTVIPDFQPLVNMVAPSGSIIAPNSSAGYTITLFNHGNGNDNLSLVATFGTTDQEEGWTVSGLEEEYGPIMINGSLEVELTIGAPFVAADTVATLILTASSERAPSLPGGSHRTFVEIQVDTISNPRFLGPQNDVPASPGSTVPVTLSIVNSGNALDDTIDLVVSDHPSDWKVQLDKTGIPLNGLDMDESTEVILYVTLPEDTVRGTYHVKLNLTGGTPSKTSDQLDLIFNVWNHTEGYHLKISPTLSSKEGSNGDTLTFIFEVENTGTFDDTFHLDVNGAKGVWDPWASLEKDTVDLAIGSSESIELSVAIPKDAPADSDLGTGKKDDYGFILTGTSTSDPVIGTWTSNIFVDVRPFYNFALQPESTLITTVREDTSRFEIQVSLVNQGNTKDILNVDLDGPDWANLGSIHPDPGFGESATIDIWCEHPPDVEIGDHHLDLKVTSQGDPSIERTLRLTVRVVSFDFEVTQILVHGETEGEIEISRESPLQVKVSITNIGESDFFANALSNISIEVFMDEQLLDKKELTTLNKGESVPVSVLWDDPTEGSHRVYAIVDARDRISEVDTGNNRLDREFSISFTPSDGVPDSPQNTPLLPVPKEVMILSTTSLATLLTLLLIFTTEFGLYAALTFFIPLYTRLSKKQILDNYLRGKIHGYIIANPGDNFTSIKRRLGITNGTFAYHLRLLEREGMIKSRRDGKLKRFYPMGTKIPDPSDLPLTDIQKEIMDAIKETPGLSQKEISDIIDHSVQVVNYHLKSMEAASIVRMVKVGRVTKCYQAGPK